MTHANPTRRATANRPAPRPLYLNTAEPLQLSVQTDSLRIRQTGHAPRRIPLSRIERVLCNHNTHWHGSALVAFLEAGIPVCWVGRDGDIIGMAIADNATAESLHGAIEHYLRQPDWPEHYANWLRHQRLRLLTAWARETAHANGNPDGRIDAHRFRDLKRSVVYQGRIDTTLDPYIRSICHAHIIERLHEHGLWPRYHGDAGTALELADDLTHLIWIALNLEHGGMSPEGRTAVRMTEGWLAENAHQSERHLNDLKRHIAQERNGWH